MLPVRRGSEGGDWEGEEVEDLGDGGTDGRDDGDGLEAPEGAGVLILEKGSRGAVERAL